jgi:hypothetical protein
LVEAACWVHPQAWLADIRARITVSTSYCRGTGSHARHRKVRQPDRGGDRSVFTIGYVANLLGKDEDWLHELSIDTFPEDGRLWGYRVSEDGVTAFSEDGIENLRQIIVDERTAGRAPPSIKQAIRPSYDPCFPRCHRQRVSARPRAGQINFANN